ncbi:MAG: thiol peroxidase [Alcanivoracaceae bacterium]|nr:thiol peroxidase [Alcanivoracaceae bacterium]
MSTVHLQGNPVQTSGDLPGNGDKAPDFKVVTPELDEVSLSELAGKKVVLNIFPSVDTEVCALQLKSFANKLAGRDDVAPVFVSMDLPFAQARFCAAEGVDNAITGSDFRYRSLADSYGVALTDGPLAGLYARATLVIDSGGVVRYSQLVNEITDEPDYEAAMAALDDL